MKLNHIMRTALSITATILLTSLVSIQAADVVKSPTKPNIIFIVSDDQGAGDYSFMGHPHIQTPHIDKLASQSLAFKRGFVPSSVCCPSLASIITGLYPHQHKVTANDWPRSPSGCAAA
jgi:arylsulfatase A-like enzyme